MTANLIKQIEDNQKIIALHRPFDKDKLLPYIKDYYRVGQVYTSNALEGFSYTESETAVLLNEGLTAGGKPLRDMYAVIGHAKAYDHMYTLLGKKELTEDNIKTFHSMLVGALDNNAQPGEYRDIQVFITGSKYPLTPVKNIPEEMQTLMRKVQENRDKVHPVQLAAYVHMQLAFIHPFADGNGRIARLAMNTILIQHHYLPTIIPPVLRGEYVGCLEKARTNASPFYDFIFRCEHETQREMVGLLAGAAEDYVSIVTDVPLYTGEY